MVKTIRCAVVGLGDIAQTVHFKSFRELPALQVAALCDVNEENLFSARQLFPEAAAYTDLSRLLDSERVDCAFVFVKPSALFPLASACLEAKLPVFMEKPPGKTTKEVEMLIEIAARNQCHTMVGMNRRFSPLVLKVREIVEGYGPPVQIVAEYYKNLTETYDPEVNMLVYDAIHSVDLIRWLGGEVRDVHCVIQNGFRDFPHSFNCIFEFENGATGVLCNNYAVGPRQEKFELHASGISAYMEPPKRARLLEGDRVDHETVIDVSYLIGSHEFHRTYGFYDEMVHFLECVESNRETDVPLGEALTTMTLIDRMLA